MYFPNDSYTGVFIRPRTVTKLRTLGQLKHRSVATLNHVMPIISPHSVSVDLSIPIGDII